MRTTLQGFRPAMAALVLASAASGCSQAPRLEKAKAPPIDLERAEVVDLTYPFDERTIYWPTSPHGFRLEKLHAGRSEAGYYYSSYLFSAPEHGGTHFDAPSHFAEGQASAGQVPPRRLMGRAAVIDVASKAAVDPDYRLTVADMKEWEARNGPVWEGAIVLLRTGWGKRWPDKLRFLGDDAPGDVSKLHFPSYGRESVEYLVRERKIGVLGVDTASIDHGPSRDFIVHQVTNGAGVPGLENVANLDRLPETGAWVIALPMKIAGGSGGPLRIVAFLSR